MTHNCIKCGVTLVVGENIAENQIRHSIYTCKDCNREYNCKHRDLRREYKREWRHRTGRQKPMSENRGCAAFLGVHVTERVLSFVFDGVQRMPYGNTGFDFICGGGYKIDAKSACRFSSEKRADCWKFHINNNPTADYFLCLAFNNRINLTPEHIWLIPAADINDHKTASISETALDKWSKYERPLDKMMACCNVMKRCDD